jgi:hypothetical protein
MISENRLLKSFQSERNKRCQAKLGQKRVKFAVGECTYLSDEGIGMPVGGTRGY